MTHIIRPHLIRPHLIRPIIALPYQATEGAELPAYDTSGVIDEDVCFASEDFPYVDTAELLVQLGTSNNVGLRYWQCENNDLLAIDETVTVGGHHTLQMTFPGGGVATTPQPKIFTRNALHGGNGTDAPFYNKLWRRYRVRFTDGFGLEGTPGSQGGAAWSYKSMAYGWLGGSTGHTSGRSTHEYMGGVSSPNTLKNGLQAISGVNNYTDIALDNDLNNAIGTMWTDELFRDVVDLLEYDDATGLVYRLRTWWAVTGAVPTKFVDLTGDVIVTAGHENDPGLRDTVPRADRLELGANYNRLRTDPLEMHIGSWELADGVAFPNAFRLPAAELL